MEGRGKGGRGNKNDGGMYIYVFCVRHLILTRPPLPPSFPPSLYRNLGRHENLVAVCLLIMALLCLGKVDEAKEGGREGGKKRQAFRRRIRRGWILSHANTHTTYSPHSISPLSSPGIILFVLRPILIPFAVSLLFYYILQPVVNTLNKVGQEGGREGGREGTNTENALSSFGI